jgi:hypothetical protein
LQTPLHSLQKGTPNFREISSDASCNGLEQFICHCPETKRALT